MIRVLEKEMSGEILWQAYTHVKPLKGATFDDKNHKIVIPFPKGTTEEELMSDGMLGKWFVDNGFDISFETGDYEYTTKGEFNTRSMIKYKGRQAFLRDRLIATVTW